MKTPIIFISAKGKTPEELANAMLKSIRKYVKAETKMKARNKKNKNTKKHPARKTLQSEKE